MRHYANWFESERLTREMVYEISGFMPRTPCVRKSSLLVRQSQVSSSTSSSSSSPLSMRSFTTPLEFLPLFPLSPLSPLSPSSSVSPLSPRTQPILLSWSLSDDDDSINRDGWKIPSMDDLDRPDVT